VYSEDYNKLNVCAFTHMTASMIRTIVLCVVRMSEFISTVFSNMLIKYVLLVS